MTDPELVQQSLAVLRAYLAQTGPQGATGVDFLFEVFSAPSPENRP